MEDIEKTSSIFEIFSFPSKGLGLKAKKNLKAGEIVLKEEAICHVLTRKERGLKCDFCLEDGSSLQKCSCCKFKYYCGVDCQRKDWTLHKEECKCLQKVQPKRPPDICLLAARFLTKLIKSKPETKSRKLKQIIEFQKKISEKDDIINGKRKEMFFTFAFVLQQFAEEKTFSDLNLKPSHSFGLLCWMTCNCFTILDAEMGSIGIGIYDHASLINHSCQPNCVALFDSSKITICPVRPISEGDEIMISYIECLETTKARQKELSDRYFFNCQCSRCQADADASQKDKLPSVVQEQSHLETSLASCKEAMTSSNFDNLQAVVKKASKYMPVKSIVMTQCYEALFDGCIEFEKWELAVEYGSLILEMYLEYYEELHPSTGIHLFKLGKIQLFLDRLQEGVEYLQRAKKILSVTHGRKHPLMAELEEMLVLAIREINETNNYKALEDAHE